MQPANILEIDKIKAAINHTKTMRAVQDSHVALFLGFSGTGKSTSIITLSGQEMIGYHNKIDGAPVLMNKYPDAGGDVFIEEKMNSGTKQPAFIQVKNEPIALWDLPGLGDSRGITQTLINTLYIQKIFNIQSSVKLIFTINYADLVQSQKGRNLSQTVAEITKSLSQFKNYHKSLAILITKSDLKFKVQNAINCFKEIMEKIEAVRSNSIAMDFFSNAVNGVIPILIMKQPKLDQENEVTQDYPADVTNDYLDFISKTVNVIKGLSPAKFPQITVGQISDSDKNKCKDVLEQTRVKIAACENAFLSKLLPFIASAYNKVISFTVPTATLDKIFSSLANIKNFINKLMTLCDKAAINGGFQAIDREKLDYTMKQIISLCEDPLIFFDCGPPSNKCISLANLQQEYPIVDFFAIIDFKTLGQQYNWVNMIAVMRSFFTRIKGLQGNLKNKIKQEEDKLCAKIQQFGEQKIKLYINEFYKSSYLQEWSANFRSFPSAILLLTNYDSSPNTSSYYRNLEDLSNRMNINTQHLSDFQAIIALQNTHFNRLPQMNTYGAKVKNQLLAFAREEVGILTKFQSWSKHEADNFLERDIEMNEVDHQVDIPQGHYFPMDPQNSQAHLNGSMKELPMKQTIRKYNVQIRKNNLKIQNMSDLLKQKEVQLYQLNQQMVIQNTQNTRIQQQLRAAQNKLKAYQNNNNNNNNNTCCSIM